MILDPDCGRFGRWDAAWLSCALGVALLLSIARPLLAADTKDSDVDDTIKCLTASFNAQAEWKAAAHSRTCADGLPHVTAAATEATVASRICSDPALRTAVASAAKKMANFRDVIVGAKDATVCDAAYRAVAPGIMGAEGE